MRSSSRSWVPAAIPYPRILWGTEKQITSKLPPSAQKPRLPVRSLVCCNHTNSKPVAAVGSLAQPPHCSPRARSDNCRTYRPSSVSSHPWVKTASRGRYLHLSTRLSHFLQPCNLLGPIRTAPFQRQGIAALPPRTVPGPVGFLPFAVCLALILFSETLTASGPPPKPRTLHLKRPSL